MFHEGDSLKTLGYEVNVTALEDIVTTHAIGAAASFIPFFGNMSASMLTMVANFACVYLAAVIYVKMLSALMAEGNDVGSMTEEELKASAKMAAQGIDMKEACSEARSAFKTAKDGGAMKGSQVKPME